MKKVKFIFVLILAIVAIYSCERKKGLLPVAATVPPPPGFCDTITYAKQMKNLIDANCANSCHSGPFPSGGVDLASYANAKTKALDGRMKARAIDGIGGAMPQVGLLPQSQRDLIQCWINNGAKP